MKLVRLLPLLLLASSTLSYANAPAPPSAEAEELASIKKFESLPWVNSGKSAITERADITLPASVRYLDAKGTNQLLALTGNLPEPESYVVAPKALGSWFAVYAFDAMGYVKDDEKIDPEALLKSMRESQEASNEQRKEQGMGPLNVVGWAVPPHYDPKSHNLEYGITLSNGQSNNINYHLRMLGRRGVMDATLITQQETLQQDLAAFRAANSGFAYHPDESYAAYKEGDKVSEYGLAALVTGGAAAAVLKGGGLLKFLAVAWKFILIGLLAVGGVFRGFFSRLFGKGEEE